MKVVIIGPAYPLRGGVADFNETWATSLAEGGDEAVIYSFYYQYPKILFPGTTQLSKEPKTNNVVIHPTISSINPFSWSKTATKIAREKPDIVIIRYWLPFLAPSLGTIAKKLRKKKIKVVALTDNLVPHEKHPGDEILTRYFIKQCDGFITMSRSVLNDLSRFTGSPNKIFLPHPFYKVYGERIPKSEARKNLGLPLNDKIILFFGFIREYKGLKLLLDAMNDSRIKNLNVKLLVAGEFYEDKNPYLEKINANRVGENVILHTHFIDNSKVKNYFCAADIIVQPYLHATQSGVSLVAYFFGRPMLVTRVGGLPELVPHGKVGYVTEKTPESIADSIYDFYVNNREEGFSKNVDSEGGKFSWEYFIKGMKELYEKIR